MNNTKYLKSNKFKSLMIDINFNIPYNRKDYAALQCLSRLIGEVSNKYQTKSEMTKIKDNLYDGAVLASALIQSDIASLDTYYIFVNPKYLDDIEYKDYLDFIKETIFNLYLDEKNISEQKSLIISSIKRKLDKPSTLSFNNAIKKISEYEDILKSYNIDIIKDIEDLTIEDIKETYQKLLNNSSINIILVGDIEKEFINDLEALFKNNSLNLKYENYLIENNINKHFKDEAPFTQSHLNVFYTNKKYDSYEELIKYRFTISLLGSLPSSLLFLKIREEMGLCYSISASPMPSSSLTCIKTIIDASAKEIVLEEIEKQIESLIKQTYDLELLEIAKTLLINVVESIEDDAFSYLTYYRDLLVTGYDNTIDDYIKILKGINADDVSNIAKDMKFYCSYILEGKLDEENN